MENVSEVKVGSIVQYHGSRLEYYGKYRISAVPTSGTRGYSLFSVEPYNKTRTLHNADRSSFTVLEEL